MKKEDRQEGNLILEVVRYAVQNLDEFDVYHDDFLNEELAIIHEALDKIEKKLLPF